MVTPDALFTLFGTSAHSIFNAISDKIIYFMQFANNNKLILLGNNTESTIKTISRFCKQKKCNSEHYCAFEKKNNWKLTKLQQKLSGNWISCATAPYFNLGFIIFLLFLPFRIFFLRFFINNIFAQAKVKNGNVIKSCKKAQLSTQNNE